MILRLTISISFEESLIKRQYLKIQNLTKHGVQNWVAMATSDTPEFFSGILFSNTFY